MNRSHGLAAVVLLALWYGLALLCPSSVGWRDSGEFLLSAIFLDIPHPAGFPSYSMLANSGALLPFGHVAWRVHLFSSVCVLLVLYNVYRLAEECLALVREGEVSTRASLLTGMTALALCSPFLRGGVTAEVYLLNGVLLLYVVRCLARSILSNDVRWTYMASFIGGLAVGNHAAAGLTGLWIAAYLIANRTLRLSSLCTSALLAVFGMSVYAYLPVRAAHNPPLNTGSPTDISRFINHISDARDRYLRTSPPTLPNSTHASPPGRVFRFGRDVIKGAVLFSPVATIVGIAGLLIVLAKAPRIGVPLLGLAVTNLAFFSDWDPDPWVPFFAVMAVGVSVALSSIAERLPKRFRSFAPIAFALIVLTHPAARIDTLYSELAAHTNFELPAASASALLKSAPPFGMVVTEPSWFTARYLQAAEGVRSDVTLAYVPSMLFPAYFYPLRLERSTAAEILSTYSDPRSPEFENVARAVSAGVKSGPVVLEPTPLLASPFRAILVFTNSGLVEAIENTPGRIDGDYASQRAKALRSLVELARDLPRSLKNDTMSFVEILLAQETGTLKELGFPRDACFLASTVCSDQCPPRLEEYTRAICSEVPSEQR